MSTLRNKLAHLTYQKACKLLGADAAHLLNSGGRIAIDVEDQVTFTAAEFRLELYDASVVLTDAGSGKQQIGFNCSTCLIPCVHAAAALSLVLEEKMTLGLAAPPPERQPIESLTEEELVDRAIQDRRERAAKENLVLEGTGAECDSPWCDFLITNKSSGRTYRAAVRGWEIGESYCSCPDFRKNTLGTCKHLLFAIEQLRERFPAPESVAAYVRTHFCVHTDYSRNGEIRLLTPDKIERSAAAIVGPITARKIDDFPDLVRRIRDLELQGHEVTVYPDAEEEIHRRLVQQHLKDSVAEIRADPSGHPLRLSLLKTELLPYQLDGIAFAVGAGRAILADDMGLGKTIQGIGVTEMLVRECGIRKTLVICPTSLKSQWLNEITRFTDHSCQIVVGSADVRAELYDNSDLFTICNYEQVLRDITAIERVSWDLIILDEGQRIKNWEAKTSRIVKSLKSPYALVLSGTPLENRLEELFSIVEFIDDRRLGPAFRFFNTHKMVDERGKPLGYKNLDALRRKLEPIVLRRTRKMVLDDLPPRSTEILRIPPTDEQLAMCESYRMIITRIVNKPYMTEMDMLRLQKALLMSRMAANSTFLVDKLEPGYSSKLDEIATLLDDLFAEDDRKIILFSEWKRMLDLIQPIVDRNDIGYVRLDGSVPQKQRQVLINRFQRENDCRLFMATNAGSTGLNLQAANTVVNVDLPWNPAVLEQRIARAHRMGQKKPVQVYILITEATIEESLLSTLAAKQELATAALDLNSETDEVCLNRNIDELKQRLEVLLGCKPDAPVDQSQQECARRTVAQTSSGARLEAAGGQLFTAAFSFIGEMLPEGADETAVSDLAASFRTELMKTISEAEDGTCKMTLSLPGTDAVDAMAQTLAKMAAMARK